MFYLWFCSLGFCCRASWAPFGAGVKYSDGIAVFEWVWHMVLAVFFTRCQVASSRVGFWVGYLEGPTPRPLHRARQKGTKVEWGDLAYFFQIFCVFPLFSVFLLLRFGFCPWVGFQDHVSGGMEVPADSGVCFSFAFLCFALFQATCICRCSTEWQFSTKMGLIKSKSL